jgi:protoporphyrinogen oxidase
MAETWLVVGGGFRGVFGAYLLATRKDDVVLLDRGKRLGAAVSSAPWKGFHLDNGCHLFDNSDDTITSIVLDILGDNVAPVAVRYASVTNRVKVDGISIPDLGAYGPDVARTVLSELVLAAATPEGDCRDLQDKLDARFGATAARYLAAAATKMYRVEPDQLDTAAFRLTPFRRIKFLADAAADRLKQNPVLDDRIASSSETDPMRFYRERATVYPHRNFYPRTHGMRGFFETAGERLKTLGVSVRLDQDVTRVDVGTHAITLTLANGTTVSGDRLLWADGLATLEEKLLGETTLAERVHRVPMVLHYFLVEKGAEGPYTYVQDFDAEDYVFRASVPGSYVASTAAATLTYVCCEVPTTTESPEWKAPEAFADRAWRQLQRDGVVLSNRAIDALTVKTGTSYWVPRVGYGEAREHVVTQLHGIPRILCADDLAFSKEDIIRSLLQAIADA